MHRKTKKREISGWTKPVNIFILPYREVRINKANVNKWFLSAAQVIYNLNGFYDDMKALLQRMIDDGFSTRERQHGIYFASDLAEIEHIIAMHKA